MPDKYQQIRDHHEIELQKARADLDKKYKRKDRRILILGAILFVIWTYFCFFYW